MPSSYDLILTYLYDKDSRVIRQQVDAAVVRADRQMEAQLVGVLDELVALLLVVVEAVVAPVPRRDLHADVHSQQV